MFGEQTQAEPSRLVLSRAEGESGHEVDDDLVRLGLVLNVRRSDDDRPGAWDANEVEMVVPGHPPITTRQLLDLEHRLEANQIGRRGSRRRLETTPLAGREVGGNLGALRAIVVAGPGLFRWFGKQVLDA